VSAAAKAARHETRCALTLSTAQEAATARLMTGAVLRHAGVAAIEVVARQSRLLVAGRSVCDKSNGG